MRIGLLSDIHGNLSGLEAVAAALDREGPLDAVVVAGDHLLGGARPLEVWTNLFQRGWTLIRGNEDEALIPEQTDPSLLPSRFTHAYEAQRQWARAHLGPAILRDVAALPDRFQLATPAGQLLVVHSSPRSTSDRAGGIQNTDAEVVAAYSGTGATAIAFGHYHRSFVRPMPFALLVNVASVGIPDDQQSLAAYTVLHAREGGWVVEQRRVPYDLAAQGTAAARNGFPPWLPD